MADNEASGRRSGKVTPKNSEVDPDLAKARQSVTPPIRDQSSHNLSRSYPEANITSRSLESRISLPGEPECSEQEEKEQTITTIDGNEDEAEDSADGRTEARNNEQDSIVLDNQEDGKTGEEIEDVFELPSKQDRPNTAERQLNELEELQDQFKDVSAIKEYDRMERDRWTSMTSSTVGRSTGFSQGRSTGFSGRSSAYSYASTMTGRSTGSGRSTVLSTGTIPIDSVETNPGIPGESIGGWRTKTVSFHTATDNSVSTTSSMFQGQAKATDNFRMAMIATVLGGLVFGTIALVCSLQAHLNIRKGKFESAERWRRVSLTFSMISLMITAGLAAFLIFHFTTRQLTR